MRKTNRSHKEVIVGKIQLVDGLWTYSVEAIWYGLQDCYADLRSNVKKKVWTLRSRPLAAIGISAMMHGYMAFNEREEILVPFRTWEKHPYGQGCGGLIGIVCILYSFEMEFFSFVSSDLG